MNPVYHQAQFINSAPRLQDAPPDQGMEIAFAGRSNAGKSSAINTLVQQNALARVSKTPGRTQLLNFFAIDDQRKLVDLPGYGYAKVPEAIKKDWQQMMENYLKNRKALCGIVLVMDIRHPLTEFDWQMINWCEHSNLPLHILLTKADKLGLMMYIRFWMSGSSFRKRQSNDRVQSVKIGQQSFNGWRIP